MSTIAVQNNVISSGNPTSVEDFSRSTSAEDINSLKLFLLQRTKEYEIDYFQDSHKTVSAVVAAYSAVEARQLLQEYSEWFSYAEVEPEPGIVVKFWTRDACATCVKIGEVTGVPSSEDVPGVVNAEYV